MGCFVSCFRSRDLNRNARSRNPGAGARSNSDASFDEESLEEPLVAENQFSSLFFNDTEENIDLPPTLDEELRLEANHLKLCGAILETPMEIRKSNRRIALQELNGLDQSPRSAHASSNKTLSTPGSRNESPISQFKTPSTESAEETRGGNLNLTPLRYGMRARASILNSPYPTPITLTEDMQTPATIYSSYQETSVTGKRARIRAQYAYPESKGTCEIDMFGGIKFVELERENEVPVEFSFGTKQNSVETPKVMVSDLSEWLKPTSSLRGRNGIPNSTTKYKEDQKVKWHATPFEERLEKVLSDEKLPPPRYKIQGAD